MIRIESIRIHNFRGIRELKIDLAGQNFAACGPNGTGKSGIVDAIEFALTGNISRLLGTGTGGLSVKSHGPHVDHRNNPAVAFVALDVTIPALLDKKATIIRSVKAAGTPKITPMDADVVDAFNSVALHPEFALSRREIIRYVLSEPGKRATEVQTLLRLDEIEKLRTVLQRIANACSRTLPDLERAESDARKKLLAALDEAQFSTKAVLDAVNSRRESLGLPRLEDLETTTSVKDGMATTATAGAVGRVLKVQANADLNTLREALGNLSSTSFTEGCRVADALAAELARDAENVNGLALEALLRSAVEIYDGTVCPVCVTPFEPDEFKAHVVAKLGRLEEVTKKRAILEAGIRPLLDTLHGVRTALATVMGYARLFEPKVDASAFAELESTLLGYSRQLVELLPLDDTRAVLASAQTFPNLAPTIDAFAATIDLIPEPTKQDAAREFLVIVQERLENYRASRGHFPPGAYHSEGHQDAMGLCLYLALMNHLLGNRFTIAVLDDVLMSVDSGHRRQVCTLLRENFPNTQFIFTTHD